MSWQSNSPPRSLEETNQRSPCFTSSPPRPISGSHYITPRSKVDGNFDPLLHSHTKSSCDIAPQDASQAPTMSWELKEKPYMSPYHHEAVNRPKSPPRFKNEDLYCDKSSSNSRRRVDTLADSSKSPPLQLEIRHKSPLSSLTADRMSSDSVKPSYPSELIVDEHQVKSHISSPPRSRTEGNWYQSSYSYSDSLPGLGSPLQLSPPLSSRSLPRQRSPEKSSICDDKTFVNP